MANKDFILILGPQGSGKSTQGKLLAEYIGYTYLSSGQFLRQLSEQKNPIGEKLAQYWVKGNLVPDEIIEEIIFGELEKVDTVGFILDGFPRDLPQLRSFLAFLDFNQWAISHAFYLHVGEDESIKRLIARRGLENRSDETPGAVSRRLSLYYKETEPMLREFEKLGRLTKVDGERTVEEIQREIRSFFI